MDQHFDPERFVLDLLAGVFDGRLDEQLKPLSREQLEAVAVLLDRRLNGESGVLPSANYEG